LRHSFWTTSLVGFFVCAGLSGCNGSNSAPPTVNPTATPSSAPNTGGPQPPTQAGIGILAPSVVGTVTVHYDGTAGASAQPTIGSQSFDTQQVIGAHFVAVSLAAGP